MKKNFGFTFLHSKKVNPLLKLSNSGFTLVELLVVITILAILGAIAFSVYANAQKSARDAKRKADIDVLAKNFESSFDFTTKEYSGIVTEDFQGGAPADPKTGYDYPILLNGTEAGGMFGFKVCADLETKTGATCIPSVQGPPPEGYTTTVYSYGGGEPLEGGYLPPGLSLTNGLVGYWKMDEVSWNGTAGEVKDDSGKNNHGTAKCGYPDGLIPPPNPPATPATICTVPSTDVGKFNRAGFFNRAMDQYVARYLSGHLGDGNATTISVWFKPEQWGNNRVYSALAATNDNPVSGTHLRGYMVIGGNGRIYAIMGSYGVGAGRTTGNQWCTGVSTRTVVSNETTVAPIGAWTHVVFVMELSPDFRLKLYVNNVLQTQVDEYLNAGCKNQNNILWVGRNKGPYHRNMQGLIDEFRLYNRALSAEEVSALYSYSP